MDPRKTAVVHDLCDTDHEVTLNFFELLPLFSGANSFGYVSIRKNMCGFLR